MKDLEISPPPILKGEAVFVQFSDTILTDPMVGDYHRRAYDNMPGYHFPEHYMEVPYWIALTSGMMPDDRYQKSLHVVTDVESSIDELAQQKDATLLFSVMEANEPHVRRMVERLGNRAIMGGYTDPDEYTDFGHVQYLGGLSELPTALTGLDMAAPPDYTLFEGEHCIPRFTLSTGCSFMCKFCTVPMKVQAVDPASVEAQVEVLQPLNFSLIYMDDKSFGQAHNWRQVGKVGELIRQYNPDFMGYIAQTPPTLAIRPGFLDEAIDKGLRYLETGVEVADDVYLKNLRKPYRLRHLQKLCDAVRERDLPLIPNFIMGLPGDDYEKTIEWVRDNRDIIALGNMSILATHYGSERGGLSYGNGSREDSDQNSMQKSWLNPEDEQRMRDAMQTIYELTSSDQEGSWQHRQTDQIH
jgi:radical SAM superfamily enzyme YgiQ (UPF0313 family)